MVWGYLELAKFEGRSVVPAAAGGGVQFHVL